MIIHEDSEVGQYSGDNPSTNSTEPQSMHIVWQSSTPKNVDPRNENDEQKPLLGEKDKIDRKEFFKSLTVEPFMALYMLAYITRAVCNQNLLIDKSCLNVFHLPSNVCSNLDNYTDEKKQVEKYANTYNLYLTLIQTLPAVFFSMVIGPWSDKYGRKLPIIVSLIGGLIENVGSMFNVIYFDAPMYYLLLSGLPAGLCGGLIAVILCVYSLASEQTSRRQRTIKYAFIELAFGIGMPLGTFLGGILYKNSGYFSVYAFSASCQLAAIPWVVFVIKESRAIDSRITWNAVRDFFCIDNFMESFRTIIKPRENGVRMEMCLLIASICTLMSTLLATSSFGFYFARWMYNFDVTYYSNVNTISIAGAMVLSVVVVVVFGRVLKWKNTDAVFGLIGSVSTIATNVGKAVAEKEWIYYVACTLGVFSGLAPLAVRSRISKIVEGDELGKVFAFLASCEALTPVVASTAFTQIFNASIDFFPGLAYLVAAALALLPFGTFVWLTRKRNNLFLESGLVERKN